MSAYFTDQEKLAEVRREIAMRKAVYAKSGMTEAKINQLAIMEAIADDYATKVAGIAPDDKNEKTDDGLDRFKQVKSQNEEMTAALASGFTPVASNNIAAMKHENGELTVRFRNGTTYLYYGVERGIYQQIMDADSPGSRFNELVKMEGYRFTKLDDWKDTGKDK